MKKFVLPLNELEKRRGNKFGHKLKGGKKINKLQEGRIRENENFSNKMKKKLDNCHLIKVRNLKTKKKKVKNSTRGDSNRERKNIKIVPLNKVGIKARITSG